MGLVRMVRMDCIPSCPAIARKGRGRDGIGRHIGLKIRGPHGRGGSNPPARTKLLLIMYIYELFGDESMIFNPHYIPQP